MKKFITTLCFCYSLATQAQSSHLVISQIYADGGNNGTLYSNDFVELYNPTGSPVSLAGWSLQYSGPGSLSWTGTNKFDLSGTIAPGKYFLIQLNGGANGMPLPQPDLSYTSLGLSAAGGKVALVNSTTLLPANNCNNTHASVVDYVGYGTANCAETAVMATPTNYKNSITRNNNGCTDTDNNSTDFSLTTPSPRNSNAAGHTCNGTAISVTAVAPNPFCVDASTGASGLVSYAASGAFTNSTFNVVLSDATGSFGFPVTIGSTTISGIDPSGTISITIPAATASGTGYKIRIDATNPPLMGGQSAAFEIINGAKNILPNEFSSAGNNTFITLNWINPLGCFDEILIVAKEGNSINGTPSGTGSAYTADSNFTGNGTPFDGGKVVYKGTGNKKTITNLTNGTTYFFKAFTRRGTTWSSGTEISDKPRVVPLPGEIVINQFSPSYSGTLDEYIELVNLTGKSFDLSDLTIRVKNGAGTTAVAGGSLAGTIQPHSYWLILPLNTNSITVGQTTNVTADTKMDLGLSNTNNQLALIRKTDSTIIDAVGYGSINVPTYTEGATASNPPSQGGLKRAVAGADNNNNRSDFTGVANAAIELRNSSSRLANPNATIAGGNYTTLEITGTATLNGPITLAEKAVLTTGVFNLADYNLTTPKIAGTATATKYFKTSGTGALSITNVATSDVVFPVGNSTYNPVSITNGSNLTWSVNVADAVTPGTTTFDMEMAVKRTWNITPSATPAAGATVVFEYDDNDATQLGSRFDKTKQVQVWQYHNSAWQLATAPQTPATTASGRKAVTLSNYTRFSPFVITNVNSALPVHFVNFNVRVQSNGVQVQFTNPSEKNIQEYRIERSSDGQLFQTPMQILPEKNNGSVATYRWLDATARAGDAWYRVKAVETDGTISYTPKLRINKNSDYSKILAVYPNPVHGRTLVWQATLPKGSYQLHVHNQTGQRVLLQYFEYSGGNRTGTLDLPAGLPPGVYHLQINNGVFMRQQTFVVL